MKHGYEMRVFWSQEDGAYIGVAPELRGCSAHGDTPAEALRELDVAIELWIDARKELGWTIPKPIERGEGKILVRMPKSLKHDLAIEAKYEGVSLNQFIVALLAGAGPRVTGVETVSEETIAGVRIKKLRAIRSTDSGTEKPGKVSQRTSGILTDADAKIRTYSVVKDRSGRIFGRATKRRVTTKS